MQYKLLRKDFIEPNIICHFCRRKLTSLKAYFLQNKNTNELVCAGPDCAEKNKAEEENLYDIPDFAKIIIDNDTEKHDGAKEGKRETVSNQKRKALEYLFLREEKLNYNFKYSYEKLRKYYLLLKERDLTEGEISHINNIEAKAPPKLKLYQLQECYTCLFWIDFAIPHATEKDAQFIKSIRDFLIATGHITEKQKNAINNCLKKIEGAPQLK
jgi:hypothetical protein